MLLCTAMQELEACVLSILNQSLHTGCKDTFLNGLCGHIAAEKQRRWPPRLPSIMNSFERQEDMHMLTKIKTGFAWKLCIRKCYRASYKPDKKILLCNISGLY